MKKYINAKVEIYKLNAGDIMLVSVESLDFENIEKNEEKKYSSWGNWN